MSLDGLRAWVAEVERKLGLRTRVGLVLLAIAVGGAGAGIFLALQAADDSAGNEQLRALEERVETLGGATSVAELESRVAAAEAAANESKAKLAELERELEGLRGGRPEPGAGAGATGESSGAKGGEAEVGTARGQAAHEGSAAGGGD